MTTKDIPNDWLFPPDLATATKVQNLLAEQVILEDKFSPIQLIGGVDVSNNLNDPLQRIYAAIVTLDKQQLTVQTSASTCMQQIFPYIPGFLGFREAPAIVNVIRQLPTLPQIIMVDGHGISHPRGLGIACHIGVLLEIPTIGVAKNILIGKPAGELAAHVGAQTPLIWKGKQVGMLLHTKTRCNPLIISSGHRVSLLSAIELVMQCLKGYRLPEPTRQAHLAANVCRKTVTETIV